MLWAISWRAKDFRFNVANWFWYFTSHWREHSSQSVIKPRWYLDCVQLGLRIRDKAGKQLMDFTASFRVFIDRLRCRAAAIKNSADTIGKLQSLRYRKQQSLSTSRKRTVKWKIKLGKRVLQITSEENARLDGHARDSRAWWDHPPGLGAAYVIMSSTHYLSLTWWLLLNCGSLFSIGAIVAETFFSF